MFKKLLLMVSVILFSAIGLSARTASVPAVYAVSTTLVISQIQTAGATATDEFIELHNVSNASVDLNGYRVVYRSATGATDISLISWSTSVVIPAGGYYLLGASGGYVGTTPADATYNAGSMSGTGGGVAIRNGAANTGTLIDSVGYGTATNAFVETTATTAPAASASQARLADGCTDTDNNANDFATLNPSMPRNSSSMVNVCSGGGDAAPYVASTSPVSNASNITTTSDITVTFSEPVDVTSSWYSIGCTTSGAHSAVVSGGPTIFTLNPDTDFVDDETCTVTIVAANVTDQDLIDPPDNMTADKIWSFSTSGTACPTPPNTLRTISAIQGSGATSPFSGQTVTVRGTVTAKFSGLSGFFMQDAGDGNAATSDGIFVTYTGATAYSVGDAVQVSGSIGEANTFTQIGSVSALSVCGVPTTITPLALDLPVPISTTLEPYEGMLVTIPETLTVDQNFFQGRYGQVTLSADGRMYNPTNGNGLGDTVDLNYRRMLVLDDGTTAQNPNPIPYIGTDNTLRAGDTITNLTGLIDYGPINSDTSIQHYRLQPIGAPTFTRVNARTATPPTVGGTVHVASFNVLNYFNGNGDGTGFPTSRGATTLAEFNRQRNKIIPAIVALDADIVGLMEIENDGEGALSAIQDLVNGLNAATSAGRYAFVTEPGPGADAIKVAMIYQPGRVTPIGSGINYQVTTNPTYNPLFDRPPLAQRFSTASGAQLYVIVNHFKSKGSCPSSGVDLDYGQGCWNAKRVAQASGLLDFIATLQATTPHVIVIGDLNAYGAEDPINTLVAGGLINQALRVPAAQRYSYVFDGQAGYLDQALTTPSLDAHVTGTAYWHINSDEPSVIDYNTEFKPQDLYTATPYRASDHDPVLLGLDFAPLGPAPDFSASSKTVDATTITAGDLLTYTLIVSNSGNLSGTFALTDTLNANLTLISAPGLTVNGATLTGSGVVESHTLQSFVVTVRVAANYAGSLANTAQLSGDGLVHNLVAPSVTVLPQPVPDFSASSKLVNTTIVSGSELFTYTLFVANSGEAAGTFVLTDTLNVQLSLISAPGFSVNGSTLILSGTLAAQESQTFDIGVRAAAAFSGTITNTATLSGDGQIRALVAPDVTHLPVTNMYFLYLPLVLN
ncbi:MAG: ExeM/NucH family extracellular endonuclease [Anaerolineae bacterium]